MKTLNIFSLISVFVTFVNCIEIPASSLIVKDILAAVNTTHFNDINVFLEGISVKAKRYEINYSDANYIACQDDQQSYSECFTSTISDTETCNIVNGERCDKFYKNPYLPACEKYDKSVAEGLYVYLKYIGSLFHLMCTDNGDCTLFKHLINNIKLGKTQPTDLNTLSEGVLDSDCSRKECREATIDLLENQINTINKSLEVDKEKGITHTVEEMETYNEILDLANKNLKYMNSPVCVEKSGTAKIFSNNVLSICIFTLILIFLI